MTINVAASSPPNLPFGSVSTYGAAVWNGSEFTMDDLGLVDIVNEFGVSTGATDNSTAINDALSTLGALGLKAYLRPGTYDVQNPITIGNGSGSAYATWSGALVGGGFAPFSGPGVGALPGAQAGATIKYTGASGLSQFCTVQGPLLGWEISNVVLDGGGGANAPTWALTVVSAQWGVSRKLGLQGCVNGLTTSNVTGADAVNTMHNKYDQLWVYWIGSSGTNYGIRVTGGGTTNTCYEHFYDTQLIMPSTSLGGTRNSISLQNCDNVRFYGTHAWSASGTDAKYAIEFDYSGNNNWPADCFFEAFDSGSLAYHNTGTPSGSATPNRVVAISSTNGRAANPTLANLDWGYSNASP